MQALVVKINGDNSQLRQTIAGTRQALANMGSALKGAFAGLAGIGAVTAGFVALKSSINKAAEMQDFETSFATLLGSVDKAKKRIAELSKFAATTPFELQNSVKASKVLETLTKGALSTGKGLRMVGDVAASTGEPFEELAVHFGRLYSGLKNGTPAGEAMSRLQELGVLSAETRQKLEALQKQGQKGSGLWKIATNDFARFAGEMDRRSKTWNGMWSNLQDNIGAAMREFGKPLMEALTPFLKQTVEFVEKLGPAMKEVGKGIADTISTGFQAFQDGTLGEIVRQSLVIGFKKSVNFLWGALVGAIKGTFQLGQELGALMVLNFRQIADPNLWKGIGNVLLATAEKFGAAILNAFGEPLINLQAGMQWIATKLKNALTMAVEGPIAVLKAGVAFFIQEVMDGLRKIPGVSRLIGEGDGKNRTWEEMKADKKREAREQSDPLDNTTFGDMKAELRRQGGANLFGMNAGELQKAASERFNTGMGQLAPLMQARFQQFNDSVKNIGGAFMSGMNGPGFFDTSADEAGLSQVIGGVKDHMAEIAKRNADAAAAAGGGPMKVKYRTRQHPEEEGGKSGKGGGGVITSDLARVGGGGLAAGGTVGIWRSMEGHLKKIVANTARQQGALTSGNLRGPNGSGLRSFSLTSP